MDVSAADENIACRDGNDLPGREQLFENAPRFLVGRVAERRHDDRVICDVEVDVACSEALTGRAGRLALAQVESLAFLGGDRDRLRQRQLVHLDAASLCVELGLENVKACLGQRVLRVAFVVRPRENDLARRGKGADVVHVLVGFVVVDAARQPDDLFRAQILAERPLDLRLGQVGVASRAQQARLGDEHRALAVRVDGAALADKIALVIDIVPHQVAELPRHAVVVLPRGIEAVHRAAPGVKAPVDAAALAPVVHDEGRADVPRPCVVGRHHDQPHAVGQLRPGVVVLPLRAQNGHAFALGNGFDDAQKGFACSIGAVLPAVAALRPDHQAALVGRELRRHMEPVLGGCGVQYFHMAFSLTTFRYSKITTFCPRLQRVKFSSDSAGCAVLQKIYFYDILCYTI